MNKQVEAFKEGYAKCMEDLQRDITESWVLEKIDWLNVDLKKRTAEFAHNLESK